MKLMLGYALMLAGLVGVGVASLADRAPSSSHRTDLAACGGVWKRGAFVVFDAESNAVVRKTFAEMETRDPTAIQGLPLLWLAQALIARGVGVL